MEQLTLTDVRAARDRPREPVAADDDLAPVRGALVGIPLSLLLWVLLALAFFAG
jgi:hypothetical protein